MENKQTKQKARFTKQDDPYRVYEQLLLSLEEVCTIYLVSYKTYMYIHMYITYALSLNACLKESNNNNVV